MNLAHILQVVPKEPLTILGRLPKFYTRGAFGTLGQSALNGTKVDCQHEQGQNPRAGHQFEALPAPNDL